MRSAAAALSLVLLMASSPAHAGITSFLKARFGSRPEVAEALQQAKELRRSGDLVGAAKALAGAPRPRNLNERLQLWDQRKMLMRGVRKNLKSKFAEANPAMARAAFHEMASSGKLSLLDLWSGSNAIRRSGGNAQRAARKLGNKGRYAEAIDFLEYSRSERGEADPGAMKLSKQLYGQAMKSSERASELYAKAAGRGDADRAHAAHQQSIMHLQIAETLGQIHDTVPRSQPTFQRERAELIAQRMGTTLTKVNADLEARAKAEAEAADADLVEGQHPTPHHHASPAHVNHLSGDTNPMALNARFDVRSRMTMAQPH